MIHIHRKQCESTQILALELSKEHQEDILVSCDTQLAGEGQRGRKWVHADQALALSFNAWPSDIYTLTSLEMAWLTREYLLQQYKVETRLKWPNDLYTLDGKKCGGILIQNSANQLIIGIGINFSASEIPFELKDKMGSLFSSPISLNSELASKNLRDYIVNNRLNSNLITKLWEKSCIHMDKNVRVIENDKVRQGKFKGVGDQGQALIELDNKVIELFSATIVIDP